MWNDGLKSTEAIYGMTGCGSHSRVTGSVQINPNSILRSSAAFVVFDLFTWSCCQYAEPLSPSLLPLLGLIFLFWSVPSWLYTMGGNHYAVVLKRSNYYYPCSLWLRRGMNEPLCLKLYVKNPKSSLIMEVTHVGNTQAVVTFIHPLVMKVCSNMHCSLS